MESLNGLIERVVYYSDESGFAVLRVKATGQRDLITVVGRFASVNPGEYVECEGIWRQHAEHGLQFQADESKVVPPSTVEGIEKYLASGLIRGIGPHFAKLLIQAFQAKVFDIIEQQPELLLTISGIGNYRQQQILNAWNEQKMIRHIMMFLHQHGIGTSRALRIYKTYGEHAIKKIEQNPYCLAEDIYGIGFKTADTLAQKLGIASDSVLRIQAGLKHVLMENAGEGHCAMPIEALVKTTAETLSVELELVQSALEQEIQAERLYVDMIDEIPCVFARLFYFAELRIQQELKRLIQFNLPWGELAIDKAIPWVEEKTRFELSPSQREAVKIALSHKVAIITGGPGVGKTTIVKTILTILRQKRVRVTLCAPTGRAAKRLTETTGLTAKTIHRLLGRNPMGGQAVQQKFLDTDFLVVDETSMIDVLLMGHLLKALPDHAALLLVGDVDQLPSVGPGAVLHDLIESNKIATIRLTEIFRQAASSKIIINAHRINQSKMPYISENGEHSDFYYIVAEESEDIQQKLIHVVCERIPKRFNFDPIRDIQVLTPMNRNSLGTHALNQLLQQRLNTQPEPKVTRFGVNFAKGDKVMQIVNNYDKEVFNGDVGIIQTVDLEAAAIKVLFDERLVAYDINELDELTLAYAVSIHKSQGSEYPVVVIPVAMQHYMLLQKNLLYTGVTRGKKLVVLIGQKKALAMAVHNNRAKQRLTKLADRVAEI